MSVPIIESWYSEPLSARIANCYRMLHYHGLLTDAESRRVAARIKRRIAKAPTAPPRVGASVKATEVLQSMDTPDLLDVIREAKAIVAQRGDGA